MSLNVLYVIVFAKKGTMVGRLAFKTLDAAKEYTKGTGNRYRIERYVPAPLHVVAEGGSNG